MKGNFIIEIDTEINGNLRVDGCIIGKNGIRCNLKVNGDILAEDITVEDISARNIKAVDITANNISARDILAWNIAAGNIKARNIKYFAVCYAYYNIECKSIAGWRPNSRHFVLDGKITIL